MRKILSVYLFLILIFFTMMTGSAFPHCQIPCGIYDDDMRFKMIEEDILTVEKSMNEINELEKEKEKDYNQIVRWVDNKEHYADKISETVTYYFMTQRVAPVSSGNEQEYKAYINKLALLHELMFYSMKAKQTVDLSYVDKMRDVLEKFKTVYSQ